MSPQRPTQQERRTFKAEGWRDRTGRWVSANALFLALTGLSIFLLPFSVFNQHAVVVHTLIGLLFVPPFLSYTLRHVRAYWDYPLTQSKFTGWVAGGMALVCVVTGVVLTAEGLFGRRIDHWSQWLHIVSTFGLVIFLVPHLIAALVPERRRIEPEAAAVMAAAAGHGRKAMAGALFGLAATGALCGLVPETAFEDRFPDDYESSDSGPFAPSLARTATGGAYDARSLSGSAGCGTAGCHEEIYAEWAPSAHRYAALDPGFQAIQDVMATQNGPASTRYCGGCHDPISLFAGAKRIGADALTDRAGMQEGISCLACHAIQETDIKGNANYVMGQPRRYVYELREGAVAGLLADFLIRTYPEHHNESLSRRMFKTPEFCAACHKQFIDAEVNRVGWVQLQNQYDNWRASRWNHPDDPARTLECRECHMPLLASRDPAAGDDADFNRDAGDGRHRSHRFLGANQFVPGLLGLPGAEEHRALTESWLRGEIDVPEIADRWRPGPAVPIELDVPAEVRPGDTIAVRVHLTNNKVGHDFPTGPLDIIQAWVEIDVVDEGGAVVFHSGRLDERNMIETGSFMFKAEPVDRYGNLIDRHNLWEMVGVRFKRSMFPGAAEVATFEFPCPGASEGEGEDLPRVERHVVSVPDDAAGALTVRARLQYRKFDQFLLDYAFGEDSGLTAPITEMARDEAVMRIVAAAPAGGTAGPGGRR